MIWIHHAGLLFILQAVWFWLDLLIIGPVLSILQAILFWLQDLIIHPVSSWLHFLCYKLLSILQAVSFWLKILMSIFQAFWIGLELLIIHPVSRFLQLPLYGLCRLCAYVHQHICTFFQHQEECLWRGQIQETLVFSLILHVVLSWAKVISSMHTALSFFPRCLAIFQHEFKMWKNHVPNPLQVYHPFSFFTPVMIFETRWAVCKVITHLCKHICWSLFTLPSYFTNLCFQIFCGISQFISNITHDWNIFRVVRVHDQTCCMLFVYIHV